MFDIPSASDFLNFRAVQERMEKMGFALAAQELYQRWRSYDDGDKAEIMRKWNV